MRMLRTAAVTASLIGTLCGCASIGDKPGEIAALPSRTDGVQNILVARKSQFKGAATSLFLTVNGVDVAKLRNGDSVRFGLEPGKYEVGVRCYTSQFPGLLEWRHRVREIVVRDDSVELSIVVAAGCRINDTTAN